MLKVIRKLYLVHNFFKQLNCFCRLKIPIPSVTSSTVLHSSCDSDTFHDLGTENMAPKSRRALFRELPTQARCKALNKRLGTHNKAERVWFFGCRTFISSI